MKGRSALCRVSPNQTLNRSCEVEELQGLSEKGVRARKPVWWIERGISATLGAYSSIFSFGGGRAIFRALGSLCPSRPSSPEPMVTILCIDDEPSSS